MDALFRKWVGIAALAAQGAMPLVRSGATQTALTFGSQGRRLAERNSYMVADHV